MMLLAEFRDQRTSISLVCDKCRFLLQEDFDGGCLTCERCGYTLTVARASEFIEAVQAKMGVLLETLREAEAQAAAANPTEQEQ